MDRSRTNRPGRCGPGEIRPGHGPPESASVGGKRKIENRMSFLKSLPASAGSVPILQAFPKFVRPLLEYCEIVLRGESPFSPAERELIAAYVSKLNDCNY